ncbi:MAG: DNA/RNA non-specific endonuclease [Bacteroidales bacterium]|nr:DNA/RNA non-specific endonuclease [Bacteroidales bacterium]
MGKIFRILLLLLLLLLLAAFFVKKCKKDNRAEYGLEAAYPGPGPFQLQTVKHQFFHLGYSEEHEQAAWVAYLLTRRMLASPLVSRSDNFSEDPWVATGSAFPGDYRGSGYDRGHLVPAADMKWSATAMNETFFMSNISPQNHKFNGGPWLTLEEKVREWAMKEDSLIIVTGPALNKGLAGHIGNNRVSVPLYFYKVILDLTGPEYKGIAFIMENKSGKKNIFDCAVSIDSAESFTGFDFFHQWKGFDMEKIENVLETEKWR